MPMHFFLVQPTPENVQANTILIYEGNKKTESSGLFFVGVSWSVDVEAEGIKVYIFKPNKIPNITWQIKKKGFTLPKLIVYEFGV